MGILPSLSVFPVSLPIVTTPPHTGQEAGYARYTFRLRASSTARWALSGEWDRCRWVWNQCVAESRAAHQAGQECGPARLDKLLTGWRADRGWLREGGSVPQQQTVRDFAAARAKAQKDVRNRVPVRQRAGMPRFKRKHAARPTLNYTRRGFRLRDGRLHLAGGICLTVVWSRPLPDAPSSVRVYRDSLGHWYASFVIPAQTEPLPSTGRVIGVDWGVAETATTTSDVHDLPHAEHGRRAARRLARYQRMMARRKPAKGRKPSKGYLRAKKRAARAHAKVARQRQDTARTWAKKVVRDHDAIAVEDFTPKFLATSSMARKAADAAIGATKRALVEMGRKHGRDVRLVHPAHTTMDCGGCGARASTACRCRREPTPAPRAECPAPGTRTPRTWCWSGPVWPRLVSRAEDPNVRWTFGRPEPGIPVGPVVGKVMSVPFPPGRGAVKGSPPP
ncbi:transposase [Nocardiopsis sp. NPDC049922]|uniref:RNA-guided endonuclease InsQ/TnpB family protein n=1 Tax=Nocardiopsis sp. NPDC049922 TaxID=3155157 RepID=UPI0033E430F3